ncbi:MAG: amidohydrolase [Actinobacteria bacterium]|nr:MAG: amidohydrolase [Actinomycetota bacterium]
MSPVPHALAVDADSHVLEPADLWETYLEPEYRDRAIRITEVNGVEQLVMGGQVVLAGTLAGLGGVHVERSRLFSGTMRYTDGCPPASYDPAARLALYDDWGVAAGVVFPTVGILPFPCDDTALASAYCRAYNTWLAEFSAEAEGRILPIAHLNLADVDEAARELDRCLALGFKGVFVAPEPVNGIRPGNPHFDPLWDRCAEAGVPACLHVVVRFGGAGVPFEPWLLAGSGMVFAFALGAPGQIVPALASMVLDGVFDRVPSLKVLCVEAGCGWAAHLMDRLDEKHELLSFMQGPLRRRPSEYLRENVWYVAEPGERSIGAMLDLVGEDRILWGSDFPHIDSTLDAPSLIRESVRALSPARQAAVLGTNAAALFGI